MKDFFNLKEEGFFDDLFSEEKIKESRSNAIIGKYLNVVNNIVDKKRDEEVSKILFNKKGIDIKKLTETIDYYDEFKEKFEADFRKNVTVKFTEK